VRAFGYDDANRLKSWNNGTATTNYSYDASGNRTQAGANAYTYDAGDQLASGGTNNYAYTARGKAPALDILSKIGADFSLSQSADRWGAVTNLLLTRRRSCRTGGPAKRAGPRLRRRRVQDTVCPQR